MSSPVVIQISRDGVRVWGAPAFQTERLARFVTEAKAQGVPVSLMLIGPHGCDECRPQVCDFCDAEHFWCPENVLEPENLGPCVAYACEHCTHAIELLRGGQIPVSARAAANPYRDD